MQLMIWNDHLTTDIEIVDRQHQGLIQLINETAPKLASAGGERLLDLVPLRDRLMEYAADHFRTEEDLMVQYGVCPEVLTRHRRCHAGFVELVHGLTDRLVRGEGIAGNELFSFLAGWVIAHILGEDQTMARQIRAIQSGLSPERAYREAGGYRTSPSEEALTQTMTDLYRQLASRQADPLLSPDRPAQLSSQTAEPGDDDAKDISTGHSARGRAVVLIVDDQPANLEMLSKALQPHFKVRAARSGAQALRAAASDPKPRLILLDVAMPEMDGFSVLSKLRGHPSTCDIPVIFLTGRDTAEDEQRGFDMGAVDYITKPIRPPIVLARVQNHLDLARARDRLAEQNIRLEERILERAAELERANESLRLANAQLQQNLEERERLQVKLLQAQKMESLGRLAGGISHDFNNVLAAITGYTELALLLLPSESKPSAYLGEVVKASERARDLVQQILTFSRQSDEELHPIMVVPVIKEALKLLQASIPSTIQIRQSIKARDTVVCADPTKIHQVIMNLCTNAYHAMFEEGGTLTVSAEETDLGQEPSALFQDLPPAPHLVLTVSDTGTGIPSEIMDKIFDPYFSTKEKEKGTGLGLAVVRGIVESLSGVIRVSSRVGEGSVFTVILPSVRMDVPDTEERPTLLHGGGERILFVDDEPGIAELGKSLLESLGYQVVSVTNSIEAFGLFSSEPDLFDLVVTDFTMPGLTGMKLAEKILTLRPDTPIIIHTGQSDRFSEEDAAAAGIAGCIRKPFRAIAFADAVRRTLDESRAKREERANG